MSQHGQVIFILIILIAFFVFAGFVIKNPPDRDISRPAVSETEKPAASASQNGGTYPDESYEKREEPEPGNVDVSPGSRTDSVYISGVSRSYGDRPMRITLRANLNKGETVNIDDWEIKGNGGRIFIPQAVNFYQIPGSNEAGGIVFESGHSLTIYLGIESPLSKNLRLNKCTGYLNQKFEFLYSLPNECPLPQKDDYKHLSGECQNYIRQMRRCELPDADVTNSFRGEAGNECREFVNSFFNIANCYNILKNEDDFLKDEWRIWIDRENVFDSQHDWLRLINRESKIIDEYTY